MKLDFETAEFLTQELKHLIQNDQNHEVHSSLSQEGLDLTVLEAGTSKGVTLRFTRAFLEASEQLQVLEALDQHFRYSLQQGLAEPQQGQYRVQEVVLH